MAVGKDQHILESISYPDDLRQLPQEQLEEVCAEIRQYIIDVLFLCPLSICYISFLPHTKIADQA